MEMTFDKGQRVRKVNETRVRRVTHSLLAESGEWYQLNYGATWYGANELRAVFDSDLDNEKEEVQS